MQSLSFNLFGWSLALINLYLSFHFRTLDVALPPPTFNWFFIAEPIFNWGGFFVDGSNPTIHRLPTVLFLIWLSIVLTRYLFVKNNKLASFFAALLLGGVGGLTLDILAYGSVCDWLGFAIPGSIRYSMLNISDLMILFSAPVAAIICIDRWWLQGLAFLFALAVIGANSYYHVNFLLFG